MAVQIQTHAFRLTAIVQNGYEECKLIFKVFLWVWKAVALTVWTLINGNMPNKSTNKINKAEPTSHSPVHTTQEGRMKRFLAAVNESVCGLCLMPANSFVMPSSNPAWPRIRAPVSLQIPLMQSAHVCAQKLQCWVLTSSGLHAPFLPLLLVLTIVTKKKGRNFSPGSHERRFWNAVSLIRVQGWKLWHKTETVFGQTRSSGFDPV